MKTLEEKNIEREFKKKVKKYHNIVGVDGTWGEDLHKVGRSVFGNKWCGVWHQGNMPWSKIKKSKCLYLIINIDINGPGEHWLSVYVKDRQCYVWDSFGRSMKEIVPVLEKKLKGQRIRHKMSDRDRNQREAQSDCGARCLAWLECVKDYGIRKSMKI